MGQPEREADVLAVGVGDQALGALARQDRDEREKGVVRRGVGAQVPAAGAGPGLQVGHGVVAPAQAGQTVGAQGIDGDQHQVGPAPGAGLGRCDGRVRRGVALEAVVVQAVAGDLEAVGGHTRVAVVAVPAAEPRRHVAVAIAVEQAQAQAHGVGHDAGIVQQGRAHPQVRPAGGTGGDEPGGGQRVREDNAARGPLASREPGRSHGGAGGDERRGEDAPELEHERARRQVVEDRGQGREGAQARDPGRGAGRKRAREQADRSVDQGGAHGHGGQRHGHADLLADLAKVDGVVLEGAHDPGHQGTGTKGQDQPDREGRCQVGHGPVRHTRPRPRPAAQQDGEQDTYDRQPQAERRARQQAPGQGGGRDPQLLALA